MIYDKLSNINLYKGISKNLDTAIDYITSHSLTELPIGKTVIDGDNVYVSVSETSAHPVEERKYEIHKKYIDIQMDLVGIERIDIGDSSQTTIIDYNEAKDMAAVTAPDLVQCIIGSGNFIICMVNEPHKPNIAVTEDTFLKKAVFKVLV